MNKSPVETLTILDVPDEVAPTPAKGQTRTKPPRLPEPWQVTPEPWPDPVDGGEILTELTALFKRYLVCDEFTPQTLALWVFQTYSHQLGRIAPFLSVLSPEKRCGKTTALSIAAQLAHRALPCSNVSPAALFRVIEVSKPTMIIDEADSFLRENEELRGILNSGFTRDTAFVIRTVGENHEPRTFNTFCPKIFAAIGKLPGTLADRCIPISMRRAPHGAAVERYRGKVDGAEVLKRKMVRWVKDHTAALTDPDPATPDALNARAADMWRPLLIIADLCGGHWPDTARRAALSLSADVEDDSNNVRLLTSCRAYFTEKNVSTVYTKELLSHLIELEEEPWSTINRGAAISSRQLADRLRSYGVRSRTIREGTDKAKGYHAEDFTDAFSRYLPPLPPFVP